MCLNHLDQYRNNQLNGSDKIFILSAACTYFVQWKSVRLPHFAYTVIH